MANPQASLVCHGCGWIAPPERLAFRCEARTPDDDIDHLMEVRWDPLPTLPAADGDSNPFVHFRNQAYSYTLAMHHGISDDDYVTIVNDLDAKVAATCGHGFRVTPFRSSESLGIQFKDETGNVADSHKARHLFGLAILFEVAERIGLDGGKRYGSATVPLAIASCGNAALAAAVISKAVGRPLRVFIPTWADANIVRSLEQLGANITICERTASSPPGDPCFHAFRRAVEAGATPFTCQGSENGLTIDGGMTLGFELMEQTAARGIELDHLFLQVGGGALGSSTCQALERFEAQGAKTPTIHAVQTVGCQPVVHAWRTLADDLSRALPGGEQQLPMDGPDLAAWLRRHYDETVASEVFDEAKRNRERFMQPVPNPAPSIADGILDDETYDWFALCRAMIRTGGWPVVVTESALEEARDKATIAANSLLVSATGASGFAAVLDEGTRAALGPKARVGVLFTGKERSDALESDPS